MGNSVPAVDAEQVFHSTFKALINDGYSVGTNIERYQGVLEHALSKVDFPVERGIYMLPCDLNLRMGKTKGYNNKILVNNPDMKISPNKGENKYHKKLSVTPPDDDAPKIVNKPIKDHLTVWHENPKILTEKHNDEKLVITLLSVGAYHFW